MDWITSKWTGLDWMEPKLPLDRNKSAWIGLHVWIALNWLVGLYWPGLDSFDLIGSTRLRSDQVGLFGLDCTV